MFLIKDISAKRYLLGWVIAILLTGMSYLAGLSSGTGWLTSVFTVARFPTHTLFWDFFSQSSTFYRLGLVVNIFLWALMLERLFTLNVWYRNRARVL